MVLARAVALLELTTWGEGEIELIKPSRIEANSLSNKKMELCRHQGYKLA